MNFIDEYNQKTVSADEAVKIIKSGDWVDYGFCVTTVDALDKALARRTDELTNIHLRGAILPKIPAVFEREDELLQYLENYKAELYDFNVMKKVGK